MFGGKKSLEKELEAAEVELEQITAEMERIQRQKDDAQEEAAILTAAKAQLAKDLQSMEEQLETVTELTEQAKTAADGVYSDLIAGKNDAESFRANHTLFVNKVKEQNKQIQELAASGKTVAEQTETVAILPQELLALKAQMEEEKNKMLEFARNMSVLSLNAAIEAGRMGENGIRFIAAAEEVRSLAEQYTLSTERMGGSLAQLETKAGELSEKIKKLDGDVKAHQDQIKQTQKESMQNTAVYESGQRDIKELIKEETMGRVAALKQTQEELVRCKEQLTEQMKRMKGELQV